MSRIKAIAFVIIVLTMILAACQPAASATPEKKVWTYKDMTIGVLYGQYERPDIASIPITPANEKVEWTTEVAVPADVKSFCIVVSVESKKPRTYINYAIDITEK